MKAVTLLGEVAGEVNVCLDVRCSHMKLVNQSQDYTEDIFESATVYLYAPLGHSGHSGTISLQLLYLAKQATYLFKNGRKLYRSRNKAALPSPCRQWGLAF